MSHYLYIPVGNADHLLVFAMDPDTGALAKKHEVPMGKSGHAVCADHKRQTLYVGLRQGEDYALAAYAIDPQSGGLTALGEVAVEGMLCYLSTDRADRFVLGAYYSAGLATVHAIGDQGAVGELACRYPTEQCAHYIATDVANRYAFVPHVAAANSIYQFNFDAASGQLTPNEAMPVLAAAPGQGPRHLAWHPQLDIVYADNEQESSVTVYSYDPVRGILAAQQTVSTLPAGGWEGNSNAQIHIHPSGQFVYASNRGHDSIAMFAIDQDTGAIRSLGQQAGEATPRAFAIEPNGQFLYSGADGSNLLRTFRIGADGVLQEHGAAVDLGGPAGWVYSLAVG
jgi:6-phosphogluconolactonase